jgi:hypothetical protein
MGRGVHTHQTGDSSPKARCERTVFNHSVWPDIRDLTAASKEQPVIGRLDWFEEARW